MSERERGREGERKLLGVSGPNASQFLCSCREVGSLTTVGAKKAIISILQCSGWVQP